MDLPGIHYAHEDILAHGAIGLISESLAFCENEGDS